MAFFILSASILAQSPPTPCPADRPVDNIIAEVHKRQSKKNSRLNPFPQEICIWGWCRELAGTPPTFPQTAPPIERPSAENTSSSNMAVNDCNEAMELALEAAHNVEVGDYYFEKKNHNAALLRYKDALKEKPEDLAIHVRLGRVFEKQNQLPQAVEQYKAAETLAGPKKWSEEAHAALVRLHAPGS
jgi:tetratricopeptide (TPR) repeat protein